VLKIAYHVCVSARVGYASFAYEINLVVFGRNLSLGTEPQLLLLTTLLQLLNL